MNKNKLYVVANGDFEAYEIIKKTPKGWKVKGGKFELEFMVWAPLSADPSVFSDYQFRHTNRSSVRYATTNLEYAKAFLERSERINKQVLLDNVKKFEETYKASKLAIAGIK